MKEPAIPPKPSNPRINAITSKVMAKFNMVRFSNEKEVLVSPLPAGLVTNNLTFVGSG
jgi:hypothetical protein